MAFYFRSRRMPLHYRYFSSILTPNSSSPLTSKEKSRAALSLLKPEKNPERILEICRAASLTPESHLDRIAFSIAVSKLSDLKYFNGIHDFLQELMTSRTDLRNERFMSHAIVLYGQAGMLHNAIKTFEEVPALGACRTVKSLNALLFSCVLAKNFDEVKRIYVEFPRRFEIEPNLDTYNTVIKAFCESGQSSSVYSIFAEMERKKCKPNKTSFGTAIAGFYQEEKYTDVGKILEMMGKHGVRVGLSTYNIRIRSLCKLRKSVEAKVLLDGMLSRGVKPNSETFTHLIHGFCKEGNLEEAKKLFRSMVGRGCPPQSDCYFTLVYFLSQGGDFETALQVCNESMEKGWAPNFSTMKLLVNGLASISKVEEAKELIRKVKERFSKNVDMWNEVEATLPQ